MYAKLFTSIYQGTLRGNSHGLLVFTNLIAHCDKDGVVDMHPRAIAEEVGLSVDQVKAALLELEAPDEESRSPEEQGRRIIRLDEHRAWGWKVVNYVKYRAIRNADDRREQNRQSQAAWRDRNKPPSAAVSQDKPQSAHAEAEAEADTCSEAKASVAPPAIRQREPAPPEFLGDENIQAMNGRAIAPIGASWELPSAWGVDAEALGWKPAMILKQAELFRQYWTVGNGQGTRRSVKGWRQAWSNWLSKAERMAR